jgi:hypothetical protein
MKKQATTELYRLSKNFKALTINHKKGVLKTAKGLLRIQRTHKTLVADNTGHDDFLVKGKNGK